MTFKYIGMLAIKLMMEINIEIWASNIVIIASGVFGEEIKTALLRNGANVTHINPLDNWEPKNPIIKDTIAFSDAVIIAEQNAKFVLIGNDSGFPLNLFKNYNIPIIHICGNIDYTGINKYGILKKPERIVKQGQMTVTTEYMGPRPVIDLHTAGLKVGEALVRGKMLYKDSQRAKDYALKNSPALDFN